MNLACFAQKETKGSNFTQERLMNRILLLTTLIFVGFTADAQVIKPRGSAPAATASAPTAAPAVAPTAKPATTTTAATTTAGSLTISGKFPATAEATRELKIPITISGGIAPYKWIVGDVEGGIFYWTPNEEGEREVTIKVIDSSNPPLTGERKVTIIVTPRVTMLKDIDQHLAIVAKGGDLAQMSRDLTTPWKSNTEVTRKGLARLDNSYLRLHRDLKYLVYGLGGLGGLFLAGFSLLFWRMRKLVGFLIAVGLGLATLGSTQQAQAAAPTTPICAIRSVSPSVIVKEQDPVVITINVRNCTDLKSVAIADTGITFTEFVTKGSTVTTKIAANASALTGPTVFKLIKVDGTEVASPDSVFLLVLDTQTAMIRRDATIATAAARKEIAALKAKIAELEAKSATAATSMAELSSQISFRATKSEITEVVLDVIEGLEKRVAELEKQPLAGKVGALEQATTRLTEQNAVLIPSVAGLAEGQARLAGTEVKKGGILGFGGKRPLNPEVAAAAERIRRAVLAASN